MKNKISLLAIIAFALCANCANASECIGEDCEVKPIIFEQNFGPMDFVEIEEYDDTEVSECDTVLETNTCYDYNCPFDTIAECDIWYKKPVRNSLYGE